MWSKIKVLMTVGVLFAWLWILLFTILVCFVLCAVTGENNRVAAFCTKHLGSEFERLEGKLKKWLCTDES